MKKILGAVLALLPLFTWAQDGSRAAEAARWVKARDYLSCHLALEAIRSKAVTDTAIRRVFPRVEDALKGVSIDAPLSPAALDEKLRDFARVRQLVTEPVSRIDVRRFAAMPDGARKLVDTACAIVDRSYAMPSAWKVALGSAVMDYLAGAGATAGAGSGSRAAGGAGTSGAGASAAVKKPVIALGGQPDGQAGSAVGASGSKGRFDFWVLLPLVLLGVLCLVLWRKYQEIKEELRARKVEMRSFNEGYFGKGGSGGAAGVDRKAIERAVADSNVIAELNQAIGRLQLRISQLEGKPVGAVAGAGGAPGAPGSAGGSGGAGVAGPSGGSAAASGKNRLKVAEAGAIRPPDGADVFYMAGPVNNYFPNSAKSFTKDNTVYRFKVSPNKQDAEFELHTSGAPINEIVQLAESYIKSACDEENLPSYPVKNIITKKAGQAILEGDKWIIKSKALIRYE